MRVLQVLDTLKMGGAQKMQVFLAETIIPLGIDLTVLSLKEASHPAIVESLQAAGARVLTIHFPHLFSPRPFLRLVRLLRRERFDLIHAYLTYANILASFAGRLTGIPVLASVRSTGYDERFYSPARIALENFALRHLARRVLANGRAVAEFARQRGVPRAAIDVLVNAVNPAPPLPPEERLALRKTLLGDAKRTLIFSAGRLTHIKGYDVLLRALAPLCYRHPEITLFIAGGGKERPTLERLSRELGIEDRVHLLGVREDVRRLMAAADIYVNASLMEGTPVSVLEAMAAGLPIVGTRVGETPYLLAGGAGLLVPPGEVEALRQALERLIASPEARAALGRTARERVQREYSPETWRENLLAIYARLTPKARPYLEHLRAHRGEG